MMGQMFKGIIFTIVIALLSSLFVAIFLVPVLAGVFFPLSNRAEKPVTNKVLKFIYEGFQKIINKITVKNILDKLSERERQILTLRYFSVFGLDSQVLFDFFLVSLSACILELGILGFKLSASLECNLSLLLFLINWQKKQVKINKITK